MAGAGDGSVIEEGNTGFNDCVAEVVGDAEGVRARPHAAFSDKEVPFVARDGNPT